MFIDPNNTPKIAYDNDKLSQPLIDKIKEALGERDGSQSVSISFSYNEEGKELERQFNGVCKNIKSIFDQLEYCTR
jgi:hypothetical protein